MGYCGTVQMVLDKSLKKLLTSKLIVGVFSKKFEVKQNCLYEQYLVRAAMVICTYKFNVFRPYGKNITNIKQ